MHWEIFEAFKRVVNRDNFSNTLLKVGGIKPDDSVLELLGRINDDALRALNDADKDISRYLVKHFKMFLHNRVGTRLTNDEMQIVSVIPRNNFKKGELVAYRESNGGYKWSIFLGDSNNNRKKIINQVNGDIVDVFANTLRKLPESETIKQTHTRGILFDSDHTVEVYNLTN